MNTKHHMANAGAPKANGTADPLGSNSEIGRKLKQYYDDIVTEEVPDRFADLLKKLEDREGSTAPRNGE